MEINLFVEGLPPAKDGSDSIFNPTHSRYPRVIALLEKVKQTLEDSQWNRTEKGQVGLELIIEAPGRDPGRCHKLSRRRRGRVTSQPS